MPRLSNTAPRYRRHKASGQAVVTLDGVDYYLGPYGSKTSKAEYDRLTGEWLTAGRRLPSAASDTTMAELVALYMRHADRHYRKNGEPTREIGNIKSTMKPLLALYRHTRAADFGPLALKAVQARMVELGWARSFINQSVGRIKRFVRWAVSEEMLPCGALHALESVRGLQRGRTEARETGPILPVDQATVEATLPHLPPVVRDMVRFQRLVGCRPEEVRIIRPSDIDRAGEVWVYKPASHKTEHHGRDRVIFIGPKAQELLTPYLLCATDAHCFSPADSERRRKAELREKRKTPVQPSQVNRKKKHPQRQPGDCYAREDYARAIRLACDKAFPAPGELKGEELKAWRVKHRWSPNRLRHAAATEIRKQFGLEGAQVVLGHSSANVTQVYAERDFTLAASIAAKIG